MLLLVTFYSVAVGRLTGSRIKRKSQVRRPATTFFIFQHSASKFQNHSSFRHKILRNYMNNRWDVWPVPIGDGRDFYEYKSTFEAGTFRYRDQYSLNFFSTPGASDRLS